MLKIAVLFGGTSSEHRISLRTGEFICRTLDSMGHKVKPILITQDGNWVLPSKYRLLLPDNTALDPDSYQNRFEELHQAKAGPFLGLDCDIVFLGLHGGQGEDGSIQGFLSVLGIPFTGSGVKASALAMDKIGANKVFQQSGMNVAPFWELRKKDYESKEISLDSLPLEFPLFLKPVHGGSSVNTFRVDSKHQLAEKLSVFFEKEEHAILQKFLSGTEVSCGVWEHKKNGKRKLEVLPPTEILPGGEFFDMDSKYKPGLSQEITPARLETNIIRRIQEQAILAHQILGCEGYSRSDFIVVEGTPFILETNTLPGMTETSLIPQQAKAAGITMEEIYAALIDLGMERAGKIPVS
ncbi:D-alanine--D-alanine ligase [Leptospira perolatii]|uniref:D-alanine--D-alanine ligase n=1 Tax=Leptospira perolatii TaxID=2023191 RepID=A0A2M9ZJ70_9LEPT|nr:D-alanine--D-alanine ligase [Leptospira perolatii]PJZ68407.1 D-alanine--D-alanine ligase [Leptospira perolatii]PJZ72106.1 D-alanine--D-alanine ligase [Leptospira perolatii]